MQLCTDGGDIDTAIRELERVVPLDALRAIRDDREEGQVRRDHVRRRIEMLEACR